MGIVPQFAGDRGVRNNKRKAGIHPSKRNFPLRVLKTNFLAPKYRDMSKSTSKTCTGEDHKCVLISTV